jgi:hypothetical protein
MAYDGQIAATALPEERPGQVAGGDERAVTGYGERATERSTGATHIVGLIQARRQRGTGRPGAPARSLKPLTCCYWPRLCGSTPANVRRSTM